MSEEAVRVISLLPAATEIVASLGMLEALLGVSHACGYAEEVGQVFARTASPPFWIGSD